MIDFCDWPSQFTYVEVQGSLVIDIAVCNIDFNVIQYLTKSNHLPISKTLDLNKNEIMKNEILN